MDSRKTVRIDTQTLLDLVKALDEYRARGVTYRDTILIGVAIAGLAQFAYRHGVPAEAFEVTIPPADPCDQCDTCLYRDLDWRDGGWCYMFKDPSRILGGCRSHKPKDGNR